MADAIGRAPSIVRGWLLAKKLRGYKIDGPERRDTRAALRDFFEAQEGEKEVSSTVSDMCSNCAKNCVVTHRRN